MKKMIIAAAAIALATVVNAASCDWKLTTGSTYASQNVYALTGVTTTEAIAALSSTSASDWTSLLGSVAPATSTTGARGFASGTVVDVAANDIITFVILNGSIAEGTGYTVINSATIPEANLYTPPATGTQLALTATTLGVAGSGTLTAAIPEPTSGLLMLVGLAGLALRRRRA